MVGLRVNDHECTHIDESKQNHYTPMVIVSTRTITVRLVLEISQKLEIEIQQNQAIIIPEHIFKWQ